MIKKGFSYIGIFFLYCIALLPLSVLYVFSTLSYYLLYYVIKYRKSVVRKNLTNSFPKKDIAEIILIEKRFYKYFCNLVFEIIKMPLISKKELKKRCQFTNLDLIQNYYDKGISVIACTSHYGNWEWGMLVLGLYINEPKYVVYKTLQNKVFDSWFYRMRSRFGNIFIPMKQTLRIVASSRKQISMLCLASDQTPKTDDAIYWINFLNQQTAVFTGPEKIAVQTGRPVFYMKLKTVRKGYYIVDCLPMCEDPKNTEPYEITKNQYKLLTESILVDPQYWLWSHKRWKHTPKIA